MSAELCRIWLYAFVHADHGGDVLLPHFINHYHQLGITYRRMLLVVHHDPSIGSTESLEKIATICHGYNLECRFWEEEFSVEGQYEQHLKMLRDFVYDPYDWVLYADVNEFQDWEGPIKYVFCFHIIFICHGASTYHMYTSGMLWRRQIEKEHITSLDHM